MDGSALREIVKLADAVALNPTAATQKQLARLQNIVRRKPNLAAQDRAESALYIWLGNVRATITKRAPYSTIKNQRNAASYALTALSEVKRKASWKLTERQKAFIQRAWGPQRYSMFHCSTRKLRRALHAAKRARLRERLDLAIK